MNRMQKRTFGILGLGAVVVMTIVAVNTSGPEASAMSSTTDIVEVRVVGSTPDVTIKDINNGAIYTGLDKDFEVLYDNANTVIITLTHTDLEGNTITNVIDEMNPDYEHGSEGYVIRFVE